MNHREPGLHAESFGHGPPLAMVHGWGMHSGVWRAFAERLAERLRVTLVDLPGHGRSEAVADFSLDAIAALMAEAVPPRAHWLGWSLGSLIALGMAQRFPEEVRSVILMAGTPRFVAAPDWPGVAGEALEKFAVNLETDFAGTMRHFIGLQTFGLEHARGLARHLAARLHECPMPASSALRGGLALLQEEDLRGMYRDAVWPVLAVLGGRDRLVPVAVAPVLEASNPRAEVRVIEAAAHLPFLTHLKETAALVEDFIVRCEAHR